MKIKFVNGDRAGEIAEFPDSEISIGREDGNSIQLLTGGVSRYHAQIIKKDDGSYFIVDLDSTNGVKIDGIAVAGERVLCQDDEITIGEQKLLIVELGEVHKVLFKTFSNSTETLMDTRIDEVLIDPDKKDKKSPAADSAKKNDSQLSAEKLLAELKSVSGNLFKNGDKSSASNASDTAVIEKNADAPKRSKTLFNVIFYAALVICVVSVAKLFMDGSKSSNKISGIPQDDRNENSVIYFERIDYDTEKKSAFRLELRIENGKMTCTLDDIAGQRHFTREIELIGNYDNELELLIQNLKKSGLSKLKQKNISIPNPDRDRLHLIFIDNNEICNYKSSSSATGIEFEKCTDAIRDFLSGFGLVTIAQSREEVEAEARQHLQNAIENMENYAGDLSLLRKSAREFEAAISCYEQFTPAPPELKKAKLGFAKVNNLRKTKLAEYTADFNRCHRRLDYPGMANACQNIMKIAGEKSKAYRQAANALLNVKRQMDAKKR